MVSYQDICMNMAIEFIDVFLQIIVTTTIILSVIEIRFSVISALNHVLMNT